jgi:ATP-binding cassette subfamily B (MDR/TAP) protein 1
VLNDNAAASAAYPPNVTANAFCFSPQVVSFSMAEANYCPSNGFDANVTFVSNADVCRCTQCNCGCYAKGAAKCTSGGDILAVFFAVIMGSFAIGQAAPSITALTNGKAAAGKIYAVIDREPAIPDSGGRRLPSVQGRISFKNVTFRYPSRPDVPVFEGLNLEIGAGQTVALVGGSGCGKSTVTQLVQRFYDPEAGEVLIDGEPLRELDPAWLRSNFGLVSQEPSLFATDIAKNISYGAPVGTTPTRAQIEEAARAANCYNFITESLPDGFDTFVGERGSSLSGGQKQRIAIARAILRDPALLILDEATSALDNESERIVQDALDGLLKLKKRTTIIIAHRLSTVRNADIIVVLGNRGVLEQGTHEQLVSQGGFYAALLAAAERSQGAGAEGQPAPDDLMELIRLSSGAKDGKPHNGFEGSILAKKLESAGKIRESGSKGGAGGAVVLPAGAGPAEDSSDKGEDGQGKAPAKQLKVPMRRILTFSKPEWYVYPGALLAATINGSIMPLFAIIFTKMSNVYFVPTTALVKEQASQFALLFVYLAIVTALAYFFQFLLFGYIAEKMTTRVRAALFLKLLRFEVGFYDDRENSVGVLSSKLAADASLVKAAVADRMNLAFMNTVTIVLALIFAFVRGWQLTLVLVALLPVLGVSAMAQMLVMNGVAKTDSKALALAGQVLSESITAIRTVTSFGLRDQVVDLYDAYLAEPTKAARRKGFIAGAGFGVAQGIMFIIYAIAFFYGSFLIVYNNYTFEDVVGVFFCIVMAGFGMGQSAALAPDVAKGGAAVTSVFTLLDRESKCDPLQEGGLAEQDAKGKDIELRKVAFTYPSRPDAQILSDFSLSIKAGTTVALVGQSGSGKSTTIQLLERFYDPDQGALLFRGVDSKLANPKWLREQMGLVAQEPALFAGSVYDNIALGVPEGQIVTMEQVVAAARLANADAFIQAFDDGYDTQVGANGSQLSGGQKQRICLARCLIRRPKILLLDEATSALDNESERIVQETIDGLMKSKAVETVILIAHRLSTVRAADVIAVVDHGVIVEMGKYDDLIRKPDGVFHRLAQAQAAREH